MTSEHGTDDHDGLTATLAVKIALAAAAVMLGAWLVCGIREDSHVTPGSKLEPPTSTTLEGFGDE